MPQTLKKYIIDDEHLMQEWDWEANADLDPAKLTIGSNKKVWWKCKKCEHKWSAQINNRTTNGSRCPCCANKEVVPGKNDLATTHPELAKEWHPTKNGNLTPQKVSFGCGIKAWWICLKGHEYPQKIAERTGRNSGCPYCAGQKVLPGFNDLETKNPRLAAEWHPTKNGNLKPTDVYVNSRKKFWWKCPVGHEYLASVYARRHTNCPICNLRKSSSFPEQVIFYYVKKLWPNSFNRYKINGGMELDIYIPELKIAIEYDGEPWHRTDTHYNREVKKYEFCKKNSIFLYRVKERNKQTWTGVADKIYYISKIVKKNFLSLEQIISAIIKEIDNFAKIDIDIARDKNEILSYLSKIDNSLAEKRPDVAAKWNYEKNGNLTPDMFSVDSHEKVWWICDCGKEWQSSIHSMTKQICGCPICSKIQMGKTLVKRCVKERGSLAEKMPDLAKEWHPTKNGNRKPSDFTLGSSTKVWWICPKCGYEWQATVASRGLKHSGCRCCAGQKVRPGYNDLETINPCIAKEWHPTKNGNRKPMDVLAGTHEKVWWKCSKCGHPWQAEVVSRVSGNRGCPACAKSQRSKTLVKRRVKERGSLAEKMPELAKEWHPTKNGILTPYDRTAGSDKKAWWKCSKCGHEWQAEIRRRVKGSKCPKCRCANKSSQLELF